MARVRQIPAGRVVVGVCAVFATAVSLGAVDPHERMARCSLAWAPEHRSPTTTFFAGTALADTVFAGEGGAAPDGRGGHWGSGKPREVYGQLVLVDSIGGRGEADVRAAADRGRLEVVVVPWDYDASCKTSYWGRSARWIDSGLVGFYKVALRERHLWAGNRPTFDAFTADLVPFPHGELFRRRYVIPRDVTEMLDGREMFAMYSTLPFYGDSTNARSAAFDAWRERNPAQARKYPVPEVLQRLQARTPR